MVQGHQGRVHARLDLPVMDSGNSEQLDAKPQFLRVDEIPRRNPADAFPVHIHASDVAAECDGCQDGEFGSGVMTIHIVGRIGFRKPPAPRLRQRVFKRPSLMCHPCEDEVGGPVEDAGDGLQACGHQRFADRLDEWDAPTHAGLKIQVRAGGLGLREQLYPMRGQECFVGRHHGFPRRQRPQQVTSGWFDPADELHDDVDLG